MDTCDAVFCHGSPERRLEIMRDPHAGAFGIVGLVSVLLLKIAALDSLPANTRTELAWLGPGLGRWSIVLVASLFPYARLTGLGAPVKAAATPLTVAVASILPVVACGLLGGTGLILGLIAVGVALGLGRWLVGLLHGLTGDTYGAICEVVEAVVWVGGASLAAHVGF
jgi:adenosylcobinamide-GDP ribazoletransferase